MKALTEKQWAKVNGHKAGKQAKPSHYNPYIVGYNDPDGELCSIWEHARLHAIKGGEYLLIEEGKQ